MWEGEGVEGQAENHPHPPARARLPRYSSLAGVLLGMAGKLATQRVAAKLRHAPNILNVNLHASDGLDRELWGGEEDEGGLPPNTLEFVAHRWLAFALPQLLPAVHPADSQAQGALLASVLAPILAALRSPLAPLRTTAAFLLSSLSVSKHKHMVRVWGVGAWEVFLARGFFASRSPYCLLQWRRVLLRLVAEDRSLFKGVLEGCGSASRSLFQTKSGECKARERNVRRLCFLVLIGRNDQ